MRTLAAALVACAGLLAACGGAEPAAGSPEPRELTVSAAASLTDVFGQLETRFEAANPGVDVRMNFGGSSELSSQIVAGAPADVFASANNAQVQKVVDAGLAAGEPQVFVTNRLQIAVAPGNPRGIASFADLAEPGLVTVVCAPAVPCGAATEQVERATGVTLAPASEETDVRSVLGKVTSGDADAGVVYVTDVASADGQVEGVDFPESEQARGEYPIVALTGAADPELARTFVEFVRGADAAAVFREAGFGTP